MLHLDQRSFEVYWTASSFEFQLYLVGCVAESHNQAFHRHTTKQKSRLSVRKHLIGSRLLWLVAVTLDSFHPTILEIKVENVSFARHSRRESLADIEPSIIFLEIVGPAIVVAIYKTKFMLIDF